MFFLYFLMQHSRIPFVSDRQKAEARIPHESPQAEGVQLEKSLEPKGKNRSGPWSVFSSLFVCFFSSLCNL